MGGCSSDVISPPEYPKLCVDGGVLEHQALVVHHTYPGFNHREVDLHLDTIGRAIDQHTTLVGRVVNMPVDRPSTSSRR
jgi:hypothetical protein